MASRERGISKEPVNLHSCINLVVTFESLYWWWIIFNSKDSTVSLHCNSKFNWLLVSPHAVRWYITCNHFASLGELADRSLVLHGRGFLRKSEGSWVSSCKWTVVLIRVWCRQKGAAISTMALLVATTAYPRRPLGHLRLMISFLFSEFFSFPQASTLCSQISGVFYCARILFKCLYSPKPKSSNYPRKKTFVNMPIKMILSYRGILLKYDGCTYPWVE